METERHVRRDEWRCKITTCRNGNVPVGKVMLKTKINAYSLLIEQISNGKTDRDALVFRCRGRLNEKRRNVARSGTSV